MRGVSTHEHANRLPHNKRAWWQAKCPVAKSRMTCPLADREAIQYVGY